MPTLGTILPTAASLRAGDAHADKQAAKRETIASRELAGLNRAIVGGEARYYDTTDQYAIVSRAGKVLWFAVTPDGDRRI